MNVFAILLLAIAISAIIILSLRFFNLPPFNFLKSRDAFSEIIQSTSIRLYFTFIKYKFYFNSVFNKRKITASQFRSWTDRELADHPDLHAWTQSLPLSAFEALTEDASRHCKNLNIKITWLFSADIDVAPGLKQTIKTILVSYLSGCYKAVLDKDSVSNFAVYHRLVDSQKLNRSIDLRRSVFKQITALGLIDPIPVYDLIMSTELERQELAASALRQAASNDWDSFVKALSVVLTQHDQPPTQNSESSFR
jgi:hypothetical protein